MRYGWMVRRMRNSNTKSVRNNFHQPITDTHLLHHEFWFNRTADNRAALFAAFFPNPNSSQKKGTTEVKTETETTATNTKEKKRKKRL